MFHSEPGGVVHLVATDGHLRTFRRQEEGGRDLLCLNCPHNKARRPETSARGRERQPAARASVTTRRDQLEFLWPRRAPERHRLEVVHLGILAW
jgi:hypothetical protein